MNVDGRSWKIWEISRSRFREEFLVEYLDHGASRKIPVTINRSLQFK